MNFRHAIIRPVWVTAAAALLQACAVPLTDHVAADDETLCRYAAGEPGSQPYRQCRDRLAGDYRRALATNALQIDTPQPNVVALIRPAPQAAPVDDVVTGSVPVRPKPAQPAQ